MKWIVELRFERIFLGLLAVVLAAASSASASAENLELPRRETPIPRTTNAVPHVQIGIAPNPEISRQLLKRVSKIPGVSIGPTVISLPGALGFRINDDVALARPEAIVGGREFAHLHPDGSLHASLSPALAERAVRTGWAVDHPWADQRPGWQGFVMIFTPANHDEMEIVHDLIVQSFAYVTGRDVSSL